MRTVPFLMVILILFLALTGCAGWRLQPPSVSLARLEVIEAGLFEQRFSVRLRLLNPNDLAIVISGLAFEVELNGLAFANGVSNQTVTLPELGEALLDVTVVTVLPAVLLQVRELARDGGITYRLKGRLVTESWGDWTFDRTDRLDPPRLVPGR